MTYRAVWSEDALADIGDILEYYAESGNEAYALRLIDQIEEAVDLLAEYPTGRPGRVSNTYEKSLPKLGYIVAYDFEPGRAGGTLTILHIIHGARDWPKGKWPT